MPKTETRLRWAGNVRAQKQADAAFAKLKPKPKRGNKQATPVRSKKKKRRGHRGKRHPRGEAKPVVYREYLDSKAWQAKRKEAFAYHGCKCADCGATERLAVHHVTYKRLGREKMKDLLIVCEDCHSIRHEDKAGVVLTDYLSEQFRAIVG